MVCARTAIAATAARNRALRGGSRKASAPTGTNRSRPSPPATPPQACRISINTVMSTVACTVVCRPGEVSLRLTRMTFRMPNIR
jgi:hypothetical protein